MFVKQTKVWLTLTIALSLLALASAAAKQRRRGSGEAPAGATAFTPKGNEDRSLAPSPATGTPPAPKKIDTSADPGVRLEESEPEH